ncbi:Kunitz type trypsin inhibitor / miraculin [Quillaja saponaria]|uniref:Kunitz type trypsin inhibitor / miraculin n=1 Tax=Quillaja saponaria TaxID=32244 RepID=A0AAD7M7R1_QUISA|nr:Kunitz type trypsin inhibitor / miraculin [Quillaja saponaria]
MKTTLLALFVLLFSFTTKPLLGAAAAAPEPVLDVSGEKLRAGVNYFVHVVPTRCGGVGVTRCPGGGGGLTIASTRNRTYPLDVVLAYNVLPLTFTLANSKKGVVRVSTDLNVKFSSLSNILQSKVWKLDYFDKLTGQRFVTAGGVEGNPGPETIRNWFKIEKYGSAYKFVYCPTVCKFCRVSCKDIGIYVEDGKKRLALSDVPLNIRFTKA